MGGFLYGPLARQEEHRMIQHDVLHSVAIRARATQRDLVVLQGSVENAGALVLVMVVVTFCLVCLSPAIVQSWQCKLQRSVIVASELLTLVSSLSLHDRAKNGASIYMY